MRTKDKLLEGKKEVLLNFRNEALSQVAENNEKIRHSSM